MANRVCLEQFNADATGFQNVSLITGGIEAAGHGLYIDDKSIEDAMRLLLGKSLRAYLKHDGAGTDRLGQEIGFFSGIYRDGQKIKAKSFEFLESFKREAGATYDKLVELAQKVPDQFGVSLVLEYRPVWVMADGTEIPAMLGDSAPSGAIRSAPSMRIANVMSADLVQRPAANPNGLLSVDESKSLQTSMTTPEIKTEIAPAVDAAALAAKDSEIATFKAEAEKQVAELSKLGETHKAALAERDAIIATLTADKTKAEAVVAELSKERDELKSKVEDLAAFDARQLGVAPVKVAHAQLARKSAAFKTPEEMLTAYEAMPEGAEKRSFRKMNREALFAAFSVRK
jgi:hypothetical protein